MKKTVYIDKDERWPDFRLSEDDSWMDMQIEIDEFLLWRYKRAVREYDDVQEEIRKIYEEKI